MPTSRKSNGSDFAPAGKHFDNKSTCVRERRPDGALRLSGQCSRNSRVADYFKQGHRVLVMRTFSKIYGLAGLRVGYGVGDAALVTALGKVRRAFDLATPAQEAAVASIGAADELARRRAANLEGRAELEGIMRAHGFDPAGPAVGNFLYAETGSDAQLIFDALLHEGVIVRPLAAFGAPEAIRVTVGTPGDHAVLDAALGRVRAALAAS